MWVAPFGLIPLLVIVVPMLAPLGNALVGPVVVMDPAAKLGMNPNVPLPLLI